MYLAGYPENYIPEVNQVHPALQETHIKFLNVLEKPTGLLKSYPILQVMLAHNLGFLGERDLPYAHNVHGGVYVLIDMMHVESLEFQVETPIKNTKIKDWSRVNGAATLEAIDTQFFAGLLAGMIETGVGSLSEVDMLSFHLIMQQIQEASDKHPNLRPFDDDHISKVVHPNKGKNHTNYPVGANKAPKDWDISRMTNYYLSPVKPAQRELRDTFKDRKLPRPVAMAINSHKPNLPKRYRTAVRDEKYQALYEVIYKGE